MKKLTKSLLIFGLVLALTSPSYAWFLDFEWGLGLDQQLISSTIPGVQFSTTAGFDWIYGDATTGNWNVQNQFGVPNGDFYMEDNVFAFLGTATAASAGRIDFLSADGSFFTTGYCSASSFFLEAYDINGNLLDSDSGPSNVRYADLTPGAGLDYLAVSSGSANIAYVIMHDTGNFWLADNMSGDATGVNPPNIPEPATLMLLGSGLLGLGIIRRKK